MRFQINISQRLQSRILELGGVLLIGFGVIMVLSTLLYTPLFTNRIQVPIEKTEVIFNMGNLAPFSYSTGLLVIAAASASIVSGYLVLRKHANCRPDLLFWLVVVEILSETTILGWLLMTSGLFLPLPSSTWGIITATWLEKFFGVLGSVVLPVIVLCLCFWFKRALKKPGAWSKSFQTQSS